MTSYGYWVVCMCWWCKFEFGTLRRRIIVTWPFWAASPINWTTRWCDDCTCKLQINDSIFTVPSIIWRDGFFLPAKCLPHCGRQCLRCHRRLRCVGYHLPIHFGQCVQQQPVSLPLCRRQFEIQTHSIDVVMWFRIINIHSRPEWINCISVMYMITRKLYINWYEPVAHCLANSYCLLATDAAAVALICVQIGSARVTPMDWSRPPYVVHTCTHCDAHYPIGVNHYCFWRDCRRSHSISKGIEMSWVKAIYVEENNWN